MKLLLDTKCRGGLLSVVVVYLLGGCGPSTAERIRAARSRGDREAQWRATDALVSKGERSVDDLLELLRDDDPEIRTLCFDMIERMTFPDVPWEQFTELVEEGTLPEPRRLPWLKPVVLKACSHSSPVIRQVAVRWLVPVHIPEAASDLLADGSKDKDRAVRACAYYGMSQDSVDISPRLEKALLRGLKDPDTMVKSSAIITVAKRKTTSAVPSLLELLDDTNLVRNTVLVPGSVISSKSDSFEPEIRQLGVYAVQKVTGRDFGFVSCYGSRDDMPEIIKRIRRANLLARD